MFNAKFVFTVSIVAMMAVNSVLADSATGEAVGTAHNVFSEYTPTDSDGSKPGIAGVTYVNRAVNAAGNAATKAEQHAASAGYSAVEAEKSAQAANTAAGNAERSAQAANDAIAGLDLSAVGADGSYIKTISQTDGKVSATKESADTAPTSGSKKMVTSGGVYTALDKKVDVLQGTANVGKGLVVDGTTGNLTLTDVATQAELNAVNATAGGKQEQSTADYQMGNKDGSWTTMSSEQQGALNSGITLTKRSGYDTHVVDGDIHVTAAQKAAWTAKQDAISDLATIRSGATAGSKALQKTDITTGTSNGTISVGGTDVEVKGLGSAAYTASSAYATADQGTKADGAVQTDQTTTNANKIMITNASGSVTPVAVTASGSGNVVTAVSVADGKLTVTKGTTLGTSALTIKNGATNTDIATFGANATAAVTATIPAATSSVAGLAKYGVIPSGSETSTTYATIWVE